MLFLSRSLAHHDQMIKSFFNARQVVTSTAEAMSFSSSWRRMSCVNAAIWTEYKIYRLERGVSAYS